MGNAVGNAVGNAEGCTSAKDEIGQMLWAWGQSLNQGGDTEPATVCSSGVKSASLAPTGPSTAAGAHGAFNRSGRPRGLQPQRRIPSYLCNAYEMRGRICPILEGSRPPGYCSPGTLHRRPCYRTGYHHARTTSFRSVAICQ